MKKAMIAVLIFAGLAGCAVVPAYDAPVAYAPPPVAYAPPAVVVRPYFYGGVSYYGGRGWHGYPRRYY